MKQKIIGFRQDNELHWVADLFCGHSQHVRHDPPWMERPWVLTENGRNEKIGMDLDCKRCEELSRAVISYCYDRLKTAYEDAGVSGLCSVGRWEIALESLKNIDSDTILKK